MTIILPQGIPDAWQDALTEDTHTTWDLLAGDLVRHAADERDHGVRDDILTLALVACERAGEAFRSLEGMQATFDLEAA